VFYGAAQFSKDVDFLVLADMSNFAGLHAALGELEAVPIAVPRFDTKVLDRGHAVHFRCQAIGVKGLRIDVMTRLRDLPSFSLLWDRRTTIHLEGGEEIQMLSIPDLVNAKKTQREKDWPMISALVEGHYQAMESLPTLERIQFWLRETRISERLVALASRFPAETQELLENRPLLALAGSGLLGAAQTRNGRVSPCGEKRAHANGLSHHRGCRKMGNANPQARCLRSGF